MKRLLLVLMALMLSGAGAALAANPEPFSVSVTIRQAIQITKVTDLDFGGVDTVTVSTPFTVDPVVGGNCSTQGCTPASFTVVGQPGQVADVTFSPTCDSTTPCQITNGTDNLDVVLNPQPGACHPGCTFTFGAGPATYYVGGTLTVVPGISTGVYTATVSMQMVYQ